MCCAQIMCDHKIILYLHASVPNMLKQPIAPILPICTKLLASISTIRGNETDIGYDMDDDDLKSQCDQLKYQNVLRIKRRNYGTKYSFTLKSPFFTLFSSSGQNLSTYISVRYIKPFNRLIWMISNV